MSLLSLIGFVTLVAFAKAQIETDSRTSDYEYQSGQFLEDNDDTFTKDYIPVPPSKSEQLFLQGLIIEAGRHILFPKLYEEKKVEEDKHDEGEDDNVGAMKFFEMKGQPEMEQSYLNQKRALKTGCPRHCPIYKPVCGSDGKVYESECHMQKENCGSASVSMGPWSVCKGKHYMCPERCLNFNDPVCGSDGRIYHNICILRKRNCGKLIEAFPVRKCYENVRELKSEEEECPEYCQELYKPVCGSDGTIYYNECFMKKRTCGQGIAEVPMESCANVPKCPEVCLALFDPVCGSDGRLYINECRMFQQNCGKEVKAVDRSFCNMEKKIPLLHGSGES